MDTETETEIHHTQHVPVWKTEEVGDIKNLMDEHKVVGVVGIRGITAKQLQSIRTDLRGDAKIKICRNNLIRIAFNDAGRGELVDSIEDQTALIFTDLNPFKLYKILEKTKTPAPIKAGDVVPKDIVIENGPTSFKPGPIVGELQQAGIPAGIEGGKVIIKATKTVAKEGEIISRKLAEMLARLEIYPMEIGLAPRSVYEDGTIYTSKIFAIDEAAYISDIAIAAQSAFNLAINVAYTTKSTINTLLQTAFFNAKNLAINSTVFLPDVIGDIILKAQSQALYFNNLIKTEVTEMEYVYAALLMHSAGKEITEDGITAVLNSVGMDVDDAKAKALVSALDGVDIEKAISESTIMAAAPAQPAPVEAKEVKKEEKAEEKAEEEEESEESGMEGLSALFG